MKTEIAAASDIDRAFQALESYGPGSSRGSLQAIDQAVTRASRDPVLRADLELRCVAALRSPASPVAKQFLCGKLAMIGGAMATEALGELLADPQLAHAAANALQLIPAPEAGRVLRNRLPQSTGRAKLEVINALGMRRERGGSRALAKLLQDPDPDVATAAGAALGEVASASAARALERFLTHRSPDRLAVADACLACAGRLIASGNRARARSLLDALLRTSPAEPVRAAATRLRTAKPLLYLPEESRGGRSAR